jgi:hypothetical protein
MAVGIFNAVYSFFQINGIRTLTAKLTCSVKMESTQLIICTHRILPHALLYKQYKETRRQYSRRVLISEVLHRVDI